MKMYEYILKEVFLTWQICPPGAWRGRGHGVRGINNGDGVSGGAAGHVHRRPSWGGWVCWGRAPGAGTGLAQAEADKHRVPEALGSATPISRRPESSGKSPGAGGSPLSRSASCSEAVQPDPTQPLEEESWLSLEVEKWALGGHKPSNRLRPPARPQQDSVKCYRRGTPSQRRSILIDWGDQQTVTGKEEFELRLKGAFVTRETGRESVLLDSGDAGQAGGGPAVRGWNTGDLGHQGGNPLGPCVSLRSLGSLR